MNDPSTYWLTLTNIALGVVTLAGCGAVAFGVVQELAVRHRKRAAISGIDREVTDLVAGFDSHAFHSPALGLTMADGGEELPKRKGSEWLPKTKDGK